MVWWKALQQSYGDADDHELESLTITIVIMQVVAEYRGEQRAVRQQQAESREVERCMERMLSQVAAKEHALDHEVRVVSATAPSCILLSAHITWGLLSHSP